MVATGCATVPVTEIGQVVNAVQTAKLAISAYPRVLFAGQDVQLTWRIEPDDANRAFCVEVVGWRTFCQTSFDHRIYQQFLTGVPAGSYVVRVTVTKADGRTESAETDLCVVGGDVRCGQADPGTEGGGASR